MNREERLKQIKAVSMNYGYQKCSDGINSLICAEDFLNGAEWADSHPKKGLWDSEKVCNFLKNNSIFSAANSPVIVEFDGEELVRNLRKAMED